MLRLAADENFNGDILRGLLLRKPAIELVRVQDAGLAEASDPEVLEWAAENNRILLTHDRATMPKHAYDRVRSGKTMPSVFVLDDKFAVGQAIEEIIVLLACSQQTEWNNLVVYLPL